MLKSRFLASLLLGCLIFGPVLACAEPTVTLAEARAGHRMLLTSQIRQLEPAPRPPAHAMSIVHYPSPAGQISGYLTQSPYDSGLHPAIIWVSGGDTAIGDFWSPQPRDNDQSAAAFRERGIVVFYPSFRGLNGNPGQVEGFFGELDDLVAATAWLKQQPGVDPDRVYLGGHSSGGTMVLLASEYANAWAGVFAFGPVTDPRMYGQIAPVPIAADDESGARLRAPIHWLASIRQPTMIIEGGGQGNVSELEMLQARNSNPLVSFVTAQGCNHFSVLRPASDLIAEAIVQHNVAGLTGDRRIDRLCRT
jgi:dipeptidyl aminopeptidase/acylaminoacyl peptidase